MGVFQSLSALALRPLHDDTAISVERAAEYDTDVHGLTESFAAHCQRLFAALRQANDQAWLAVEAALAGEAFWERLKAVRRRQEDLPCRQEVRAFLDALPVVEVSSRPAAARRQCLDELRAARADGRLDPGDLDAREFVSESARATGNGDGGPPDDGQTLALLAEELRRAECPALAELLSWQSADGGHLLLAAMRSYFHEARAADPELALGTTNHASTSGELAGALAKLAAAFGRDRAYLRSLLDEVQLSDEELPSRALDLQAELAGLGPAFQEVGREVVRLLRPDQRDRRGLRFGDSLALGQGPEGSDALGAVSRFHALPEEQRRQAPALLNGIALLEVALGEFDDAQRDFLQVAEVLTDGEARAEAFANAYQAALERRAWGEALSSLRQALALDPQRYAPFPVERFEVDRICGAGGFGVTFQGRDRHTGTPVLIKALRTDGLDRDVSDVLREARLLAELDHPAVLKPLAAGYVHDDRQRPYLVTEAFDGQTLTDFLEQNGPLAQDDLLALARLVAEGLQAAHAQGVWHRNLQPGNVLVRRGGDGWEAKVFDFGLALRPGVIYAMLGRPAARSHTALGHSVGAALDFAAPEQLGWVEGVTFGPYSDVFSFGRVCYFALLHTPEPDDEEKEALSDGWRRLLGACTARNLARRLAAFPAVLERLGPLATLAPAPAEGPEGEPSVVPAAADGSEPGDAPAYNDRGLAAFQRGDLDAAVADFTRALELDPNLAPAYYNRGDVFRHQGQYDQAIADFAEALRLDPNYVLAYINQGRAYRLKGQHERAIADFTKAIRVDPTCADAYNNRGNAYADKGLHEKAIADYTEALRLDPTLAPAYMNRGLAHARKGDFPAVIADCNEALRLNPKLTSAYFIRGAAYSSGREYDKAIADFTRVLRLDPRYALAYNDRGLALAGKGEYDRAIADYTQALRLDPKLALAYVNRAIAYRLKGEHDRSIVELSRLLRLQPKNPLLFTNRGLAYLAKRDYDRAIADFTEALWIDPNNAEAYNRRVEAFRAKSELNKAEEDRRQREAAERDERERRQARSTAHFTRAQMHFDNGRYAKAIGEFNEALRFDPDDAFTYYNRGLAHAANDAPDLALADYTEAIRIDPKLAVAYYQRGVGFRLRGNYARAVADFTETIKLDPKYALAYRNRGLAYAALGEQAEAKADYEEAIKLDPTLGKK